LIRNERLLAPIAIIAASIGVCGAWLLPPASPLRVGLVFFFLLTCPGWALAQWVPLGQGIPRIASIVGISLAIDMLTAEALLYSGHWSPRLGFGLLVAGCLAAVAGRVPQSLTAIRQRRVPSLKAEPLIRPAPPQPTKPPTIVAAPSIKIATVVAPQPTRPATVATAPPARPATVATAPPARPATVGAPQPSWKDADLHRANAAGRSNGPVRLAEALAAVTTAAPRRALVIHRALQVRASLRTELHRLGWAVAEAADASEARSIIQTAPPEAILGSCSSGPVEVESLRALLSEPDVPSIPLLLLTNSLPELWHNAPWILNQPPPANVRVVRHSTAAVLSGPPH